jgi:rRNA maturation protein Rpf1
VRWLLAPNEAASRLILAAGEITPESRRHGNPGTIQLSHRKKEPTMKFVVIGADAAGMSAASRAKRNRPEMDITVLEKTLDVSYSA